MLMDCNKHCVTEQECAVKISVKPALSENCTIFVAILLSTIALVSLHPVFTSAFFSSIFLFLYLYDMRIHVSHLANSVQEKDLTKLFAGYGKIISIKVITDKFTNKSKGFGFVEMAEQKAAEKAIKELNGKLIDGLQMRLSGAKAKDETPIRINRAPSPWGV